MSELSAHEPVDSLEHSYPTTTAAILPRRNKHCYKVLAQIDREKQTHTYTCTHARTHAPAAVAKAAALAMEEAAKRSLKDLAVGVDDVGVGAAEFSLRSKVDACNTIISVFGFLILLLQLLEE